MFLKKITSSQTPEFRYDSLVYLCMMFIIDKYKFVVDQVCMIIQECEIKSILFQERDKWSYSVYMALYFSQFALYQFHRIDRLNPKETRKVSRFSWAFRRIICKRLNWNYLYTHNTKYKALYWTTALEIKTCYFSVPIFRGRALYRPYFFTALALYRALYFYTIWLAGLLR